MNTKDTFHSEGYIETQEGVYERLDKLEDGIWYIKTKDDGKRYKILADKLEDLPKAMTFAELEPYRIAIAKDLRDLFEMTEQSMLDAEKSIGEIFSIISLKRIVDTVFKSVLNNKEK